MTRFANSLTDTVEKIRHKMISHELIHCDETGTRVDEKTWWVLNSYSDLILLSIGFSASLGIAHKYPNLTTPGTMPSLQIVCTHLSDRFHFSAATLIVIKSILIHYTKAFKINNFTLTTL